MPMTPYDPALRTDDRLANVPESEHSRSGICVVCSEAFGQWITHADPKEP
jgi:hypothetical protein